MGVRLSDDALVHIFLPERERVMDLALVLAMPPRPTDRFGRRRVH